MYVYLLLHHYRYYYFTRMEWSTIYDMPFVLSFFLFHSQLSISLPPLHSPSLANDSYTIFAADILFSIPALSISEMEF